ncbi:MAG TPA: bacteriohemerythrin [Humidesulfovibrio sp.]|uniref:bacteriohemerythrin n=1 Tax=Humidesulfovibrio sp. TaxID=2910988 RepID=UPI002B6174B6|nr:bacteriohemerythrin [Humidesulfovibrio sp.]HWR03399.1 bacteriohemerythrin [Humidesulfovibrio sp.]
MAAISKIEVSEGICYVTIPEADVHILCGCPADSVKHLMKRGLIQTRTVGTVSFETGPNAILLSDVLIQNGRFTNLSEFPILQMFYRQGRIIPGHPNNTGAKPVLVGSRRQVEAQMEYIYRGNYGLVSEEEIIETGIPADMARQMMRLKLKFAFGKIRRMDEYLDLVVLESEPQEIRNRVFVKRLKPNLFEISYGKESVRVDLNQPEHSSALPSYVLGFHQIKRDYFAVLHSGEGDGWDINRPAMASILMFQGKVYLIDAGPNIMHTLNALGLSVNEIAGIFHTHAHDDHFCGLPDIMRADHRIPYYATPLVRASVMKKLSALSMMNEDEFKHYFEFHDLVMDEWNDIDTLEVMPVFSPHPVETTVMFFRTLDRSGYRSYAHFADIASLKLLRGMITADDDAPGISQQFYDTVAESYLRPVDLKKLDIGGGMIHGDAEDFAEDKSAKIVLAHTALPLTNRQKEIGSGAPFGAVDVLIPSHQDYVRSYAFHFLSSYFPTVPASRLRVLLNNPVVKFNPESIILKAGRKADCVYLLLTGQVEMFQTRKHIFSTLSSGAMLGEVTALTEKPSAETYRAANFVQALRIPMDLYSVFVKSNGVYEHMLRQMDVRSFLYTNRLFGDSMSCTLQNSIAAAVNITHHLHGSGIARSEAPRLALVKTGAVDLLMGDRTVERLKAGDFFCESTVLFDIPCLFTAVATKDTELYEIPAAALADVPIIRWKLLEVYETRLDKAVSLDATTDPLAWQEEYGIGIAVIDKEHRELFHQAKTLYHGLFGVEPAASPGKLFPALLNITREHFATEEELMRAHGYPALKPHTEHHRQILAALRDFASDYEAWKTASRKEIGIFIKNWVMTHILTEDRKLGTFLKSAGVS